MDDLDQAILTLLEEDGRRQFKAIAAELGVTDVTVKNRVSKLIDSGVIRRFTIDLDYEKIGQPLRVTIGVTVEPKMIHEVIDRISAVDEFYIIWKTSGAHGINIRGAFRDHTHLNEVLDRALNIDGVREYHLSILDREVKNKRRI